MQERACNAFTSRAFLRMLSDHRLQIAKIVIFEVFWKYLFDNKCLFLWTISLIRTSMYLMRVGAS